MKKYAIPLLVCTVSWSMTCNAEGLLTYIPPITGAPATRIGAGTRGLSLENQHLEVLAPSQTALTSRSEPILYWYISQIKQPAQVVEFTVTKETIEEPLLEKQLPTISKPGLQSIRLEDYGISLQAGVEYRWSIAIINDTEQRSADIIASATIRYQPLQMPISDVDQLAKTGYWYDALQSLIESHSPNANDLLKQADLKIQPL